METSFGNYKELPISKEEIRKRLVTLIGRSEWKGGKPFDSKKVVELQQRKVSRRPERFETELESAVSEIVAEAKQKVSKDYAVDIVLSDDKVKPNEYGDWLFIRVRFIPSGA